MSRYEKDIKQTLNDWNTVGNSVGSKMVNWAKGEVSGRILGVPFKNQKSFISQKTNI